MRKFVTVFLCALFYFLPSLQAENSLLKEAEQAYHAGEKAKTVAERKEAFNLALALYTQVEDSTHPIYGNGKLYYNIGNTYFQLEEYPWTILYYYRALKLMPRNEKVRDNLNRALEKQGLPLLEERTIFDHFFFFHSFFSVPERLQLFFVLGIILVALISVYIWFRDFRVKGAILFFAIVGVLIFLSLGYSRYLTPVEGVIVQTTVLYRDAGEQYAKVSSNPVIGGTKTRVLDVLEKGTWLKVLTPSGEIGYIPNSVIRVI